MKTLASRSLLALLVTTPALAQGELVAEFGVPIPALGGVSATHSSGYGVNNAGDWWAAMSVPTGAALLVNGAPYLVPGTVLANGDVVQGASFARLSDRGDVLALAAVRRAGTSLTRSQLFWNDAPIAEVGTDVLGPTGGFAGRIGRFDRYVIDGDDRALALVHLEPFSLGSPRVLVEIPVGGGLQPARLLLGGGVRTPDGTQVLDVEYVDVNRRGQIMVGTFEWLSATGPAARSVRVDGALRARDGDPGPLAGQPWFFPSSWSSITYRNRLALDDAGGVTILSSVPSTPNVNFLARGSEIIAERFQPRPGTTGPVIQQIDWEGMSALADGRVHWGAVMDGERRYFLGDEPFLDPGTPVAGSTIDRVIRFSGGDLEALSGSGGYILQYAQLADGRDGLLRLPLEIGEAGCAQTVPHSGGMTATLSARGSDVASRGALELVAQGLPAGQFGIFAVARNAASATPPGTQGTVCLGGGVGRFLTVLSSGPAGTFSLEVDSSDLPIAGGISANAGDTLHFQGWFRDVNPAPTSNLTDSVLVTFR